MRSSILCLAAALAAAAPVHAQSYGGGQSGPRTLLPRNEEIALARSAAPAALSDSATIYALTDTGYEIAVAGTNGAACYVSRDWLHSIEPHCFDAEGAASVLPMAMRRVELLHQGRTRDEADREIAAGLLTGRFRVPTRPVVSYMLSAAQQLVSDEGRSVGAWKPHVMIYYPYWTSTGVSGPEVMLSDAGKPTASLVVVVPTFVQPKQHAPPE
ncbi:MAG TPA: hypothetical protein VK939_00395 [Longimicrobiales bacterium]|nr:hypothetical protein [Longimicrobiales bacterium]